MTGENIGGRHLVAIVVDPHYGDALKALAGSHHVWVVRSLANDRATWSVWSVGVSGAEDDPMGPGATLFDAIPGESRESMCERIALEVQEHHGEFGHDPPWSEIRVIGVSVDPNLEELFRDIGAQSVVVSEDGFTCRR